MSNLYEMKSGNIVDLSKVDVLFNNVNVTSYPAIQVLINGMINYLPLESVSEDAEKELQDFKNAWFKWNQIESVKRMKL